jgi:cysteinyl-tRNA synthetase
VHSRHLLVDGKKMSKSEGSFFTPRDFFDPRATGRAELAERLEALGFPGGRVSPNVLRYALISNQYLQPMNFTLDALVQAKASLERIQTRYDRLVETTGEGTASDEVTALVGKAIRGFDDSLSDNVNTPNALAAVFGLVAELNQRTLTPGDARVAQRALEGFDTVLAVLDRRLRAGIVSSRDLEARASESGLPSVDELLAVETALLDAAKIEALVVHRYGAKKARNFAAADALRKEIEARGVALEDLPSGVRWRLK